MTEEIKQLTLEYLVRELGKVPQVKKVAVTAWEDERAVDPGLDVVITMLTVEGGPGTLRKSRRRALEHLKAEKGLEVDIEWVRVAILASETKTYLGHLDDAGSPEVRPVEGFHFDPNHTRVLYRNPPKKEKKKVEKYDPMWAQAKKICRLNQEEIRMAKELGMGPRTLMRNVPSTKQQWKLPVKLWIRELYEKRHPGKGLKPEPLPKPEAPLSWEEEEMARRQFEEQMYWEDYADRNDLGKGKKKKKAGEGPVIPVESGAVSDRSLNEQVFFESDVTDEDVPF